ncbi:hypothetical protein GCM10023201_33660 [Actinomycetospora corticicola]|uniref:Serine acetyltransferase n=1 Tax=Actinomycetospora corticicola TaxID=663602 RepID=A0A7Y9DS60_9PSEU|nr:serine acetyltransferase [Actinomycetospora corticicola]NYD34511.1 serine O-acetyltransferase [Actinomycetospora corticicola]
MSAPGPAAPGPTVPAPTRRRERPSLRQAVVEDLVAVVERDPSCPRWAAVLHVPWWAVAAHRVAHRLHRRAPLRARLIAAAARLVTGIEIAPGAVIGRRFFIDHGIGTVIGATAIVGDDVTLHHRVTLGSRGWWNLPADPGARRHPRIGDGVRIGVGASVLGPVTVAAGTTVRAHALVLEDVP